MGGLDKQSEPASVGGNQVAKLSDIAFKPPVRAPFEGKHVQVFQHGLLPKGVFTQQLVRSEGGEVKSLDYSIEYEYSPEVGEPETDDYIPAAIQLHLRAMVTDLASNNPEASVELSNPPKDMNTSKSLDEILTKLENEVARDVQLRLTQHRSGRSPKSSHAEAKQAIVEAVEGLAPRKKKLPKQGDFTRKAWQKYDTDNGYNLAVDDFLQAIKEWQ